MVQTVSDYAASQMPQFGEAVIAAEPVGRMGKPEEIGEAVAWLCSEAASFVTGDAMSVNGGWLAQ
ncbi:MAG: SDR family oxidoreductase [Candidatus Binatia bacterium]